MANTWETLDRSQQMELCRTLGAKTPEDHNRIAQHLANDPRAVDKALQEAGMVDDQQELDDAAPEAEPGIEDNIDSALAEADVQETGKVASDIPPAEPGEGIEEYIARIQPVADNQNIGKVAPLRPGDDRTLNNTQALMGMLQGQQRVDRETQPSTLRIKMRPPLYPDQDL